MLMPTFNSSIAIVNKPFFHIKQKRRNIFATTLFLDTFKTKYFEIVESYNGLLSTFYQDVLSDLRKISTIYLGR